MADSVAKCVNVPCLAVDENVVVELVLKPQGNAGTALLEFFGLVALAEQ